MQILELDEFFEAYPKNGFPPARERQWGECTLLVRRGVVAGLRGGCLRIGWAYSKRYLALLNLRGYESADYLRDCADLQ